MKSLLKLMLTLAALFASTFLLLNMTGVITIDRITNWLEAAQQGSPLLIGCTVTLLLFADLFIAMPTLTIMLLSGFFLGPVVGAGFSVLGLTMAGICGYEISHRYGDRLLRLLIKDPQDRRDAEEKFERYGAGTILLSRAVPILPEVSACMAGLTSMRRSRFFITWLISTVPYAAIASYAGSISTLADPSPAILAAIALTAFFWLGWLVYRSTAMKSNDVTSAGTES